MLKESLDRVVNALSDYPISINDLHIISGHAEALLNKGWTVKEVYSFIRNMEEVNPDIDEDTALANMERIKVAAELRLSTI